MGNLWETFWDEDEIEMPPEPASTSAAVEAASAASDDAYARLNAIQSTYQAAKQAWVDAAESESELREAVDEADADNVAGARTAYEIADVQEEVAYGTWQALEATVTEDVSDAYKTFQAAHNAEKATRAIDEGWHKAKAIADVEDAAGDASAASTAAWNDVTKAIAEGDPDALEDALDASKLADAAAEATRAVADGYSGAARLDAPASGGAYDQEHLVEDVSGGFEEVGEDIWTDGF